MPLVFFHLHAYTHERLADFVEGLAPALIGFDVSLLPEVLKLAGNGLWGGEESFGDLLDWNSYFATAQVLDDFSLQRRQPADPLLIVRSEFIHHFHKRPQKRLDTVTGYELREHDVDAVITSRQVMKRPDSGASAIGG